MCSGMQAAARLKSDSTSESKRMRDCENERERERETERERKREREVTRQTTVHREQLGDNAHDLVDSRTRDTAMLMDSNRLLIESFAHQVASGKELTVDYLCEVPILCDF